MELVNFSVEEFLGTLAFIGFLIFVLQIIFNGIGLLKDHLYTSFRKR